VGGCLPEVVHTFAVGFMPYFSVGGSLSSCRFMLVRSL